MKKQEKNNKFKSILFVLIIGAMMILGVLAGYNAAVNHPIEANQVITNQYTNPYETMHIDKQNAVNEEIKKFYSLSKEDKLYYIDHIPDSTTSMGEIRCLAIADYCIDWSRFNRTTDSYDYYYETWNADNTGTIKTELYGCRKCDFIVTSYAAFRSQEIWRYTR